MTEERFDSLMEHFGHVIEKNVEGAANRAWRHKPVRLAAKATSFLAGAGLMASAATLAKNGSHTAAKVCFWSGCAVIATEIVPMLLFKKK